jgi:hypothetical protein
MGFWNFIGEVAKEVLTPTEANQCEDHWVDGYHAGQRDAQQNDPPPSQDSSSSSGGTDSGSDGGGD